MKVYILRVYDYQVEDSANKNLNIVGIFATYELAKAARERLLSREGYTRLEGYRQQSMNGAVEWFYNITIHPVYGTLPEEYQ